MKYIDIHCHLDSLDYDSDREEVLVRMREKEIGTITIGADLESSKKAVEIAERNENVWACIGVHPNCLTEKSNNTVSALGHKDNTLETVLSDFSPDGYFEKLVKNPKVVAIGECGLDYFAPRSSSGAKSEVGFSDKDKQKKLFKKQIEFAIKYNKPLMLHIRDSHSANSGQAYEDALDILESYKKVAGPEDAKLNGNVHFFAGDVSVAKRFLDLGFSMSFTGVITFTHDYDEVIKFIPQDFIMAETDAPWVAPVPFRGKRNEPTYVIEVIKKLAEIRGESVEVLNNQILKNFKRVFKI